jgi:hypothetical protein
MNAMAQTGVRSPKQPSTVQSKKIKPPTPIQATAKQKSILESLLSLLQRRSFLGGSRSDNGVFCGITPAGLGDSNVVWSDRPLFLWQGKAQTLELRPYAFDVAYLKQPMLWNFSPSNQQASYLNQPLQAGQRYEWQATYLSLQTKKPTQWQKIFRVMEKPERDRISQDLNSLEVQLRIQNATVEEVALSRANYFANQDLWSDALQQIVAVGYSFSAGDKFLKVATEHVCPTKPSNLVGLVGRTHTAFKVQ